MLTLEEFVSRYNNYSDDELFEIYQNLHDYSEEAQQAFHIVIDQQGGLEKFTERLKEKQSRNKEIIRIQNETKSLINSNADTEFIKKIIHSEILSKTENEMIIDKVIAEHNVELKDKEIRPRTIIGSLIGGSIASLVGGVLWGILLVQTQRIFIVFVLGLIVICYGIIRLSTKQSQKNVVVLISTAISVILALVIGHLIFEIFGGNTLTNT